MIPDFTVSTFRGLNTFIKDLKTLTPGVASSSNNWITGSTATTSSFAEEPALRPDARNWSRQNDRARSRNEERREPYSVLRLSQEKPNTDAVTDEMVEISADEIAGGTAH